jgi:hypothetical protein
LTLADTPRTRDPADAFRVDPWLHVLGGWVTRHPKAWRRLGDLETRLLADELAAIPLEAPIYIAGLARSGSTLLLEILDRHPDTVSHRYQDYPMLFTPYAWQRFLERVPRRPAAPTERAHADGIQVTPQSPEAFEEMLWMAFFDDLHRPGKSAVLDADTSNPGFESFYRDHLRKLLLLRGGRRYLSKGNYNVTRLTYLLRLFPDARFVLPVRDPVWHIASLMKQHRLFLRGEQTHHRAVTHLQRVGHFEFGADRRPIDPGDAAAIEQIQALWTSGAEVEGWARYWSLIHHYLADRLDAEPRLADATLVVGFEALCRQPVDGLRRLFEHCRLDAPDSLIEAEAARIHLPTYYRPEFSEPEIALIRDLTADAAARVGLDTGTGAAAAPAPG